MTVGQQRPYLHREPEELNFTEVSGVTRSTNDRMEKLSWVPIPAPLTIGLPNLGKLFNFSELLFPHLKNGGRY